MVFQVTPGVLTTFDFISVVYGTVEIPDLREFLQPSPWVQV